MRWAVGAVIALWPALAQANAGVRTSGDGWVYWRLGNQADVQTRTERGILFEGGGLDVNEAYRWMCRKAGNGDFLVIRAYGNGDYNPYIHRLCPGINSVSTLKIYAREAASDPFVLKTIQQAEALFIAGGNQAQYVRYYQNTPVQAAIDAVAARAPVGGTSAGNAILAQYAFSALINTIQSKQALANCYDYRITIDDGFLDLNPLLANTITDDHFVTRNRMGRLVTFLARIVQGGTSNPAYGIALNEHTAFLMEPDGQGRVEGSGTVYFLRTPGEPETCALNTPVTYTGIPVYRIGFGGSFNVATWSGSGGTAYTVSASNGVLSSTQKNGRIY